MRITLSGISKLFIGGFGIKYCGDIYFVNKCKMTCLSRDIKNVQLVHRTILGIYLYPYFIFNCNLQDYKSL